MKIADSTIGVKLIPKFVREYTFFFFFGGGGGGGGGVHS